MKVLILLAIFACLTFAASPQQLQFIDAILKGDIQKVSEMMGAGSYKPIAEEEDEQAPKRRRLDSIDPSFSDNRSIFAAITADKRGVFDLLLSDPRVKETVPEFELAKRCIESGYNDIVKSYILSGAQEDFTRLFVTAAIYNNLEILKLLASDCRVNLNEAVPTSLNLMTQFEEIEDVFMLFLENEEIKYVDYDKSLMFQLACVKKSMPLLLRLFTLGYIWPEVSCMKDLLKQGEYEIPTFIMASSPENLKTLKREIGRNIQWLVGPMQWFNNSTLEQLIESKELIESHKPEIQNAFLAQACLRDDIERITFLLSLKFKLSSQMVTMLVAYAASADQMDVFCLLLSTPSILRCLDENALNSLTEWFIQMDCIIGQMCMVHIISQTLEPFSLLHSQIMELSLKHGDFESQLAELSDAMDVLQNEGLKGLAAIARLALTHHTAMVTIVSQGIFLPKELRAHILENNQDSLALHYIA